MIVTNEASQRENAAAVRRKFRLSSAPQDAIAAATLGRALLVIDGVLRVSVSPAQCHIDVSYLATKTDYQSLERALGEAGAAPAAGRWARFKSAWYQNLDLTRRENSHAPPPACCNRPPR